MPDFPRSMTSDQMASWILGTPLRNAFGRMDYNDAKQIANAADNWTLTRLPVDAFPGKWLWTKKPKTWGIPPIILEVGRKEYEVLDGRHRIGYARLLGQRDIQAYVGRFFDSEHRQSLSSRRVNPMRFSNRFARFNPKREAVMVARGRGKISGQIRGMDYVERTIPEDAEIVDMIAAGYEWVCPDCQELNGFYEIPKNLYVQCVNCRHIFAVNEDVGHAYP